jgi:hypothetical protein
LASQKSAAESVKGGIKGVDRAVSDKLVDGINIGGKFAPPFSLSFTSCLPTPSSPDWGKREKADKVIEKDNMH